MSHTPSEWTILVKFISKDIICSMFQYCKNINNQYKKMNLDSTLKKHSHINIQHYNVFAMFFQRSVLYGSSQRQMSRGFSLFKRCEWLVSNRAVSNRAPLAESGSFGPHGAIAHSHSHRCLEIFHCSSVMNGRSCPIEPCPIERHPQSIYKLLWRAHNI